MNCKKLAKSANHPLDCRMLFVQRNTFGVRHRAGMHDHPFWQFEFIEKGRARVVTGGECRELPGGSLLVIPPRIAHSFSYLENGTLSTSVKFTMERAASHTAPVFRGPSSAGSHMVRALNELLPPGRHERAHHPHVVNSLLSALVAYLLEPEPMTEPEPRLSPIERVRHRILTRDTWPVTVTELAHHVGLSVSRASHLFHETYGTTLKGFIDHTRANLIGLHLRYSDMSIKDIAAATGFEDIYSFSRFFKRMTGVSPRAYRRRADSAPGLERQEP